VQWQAGCATGAGSKVVEAVAISPRCSVHNANTGSRVRGSKEVTVALRFKAAIGMFKTARWSAMNHASKRPCSSFWAKRIRCCRLKLASG